MEPGEVLGGGALALQLGRKGLLLQKQPPGQTGGPDIRAHIQPVGPGLQHIGVGVAGDAGIIEGGQALQVDPQGDCRGLAWGQLRGLPVVRQHPGSLAQPALRGLHIDLDHLTAWAAAGVGDLDPQVPVGLPGFGGRLHPEGGVAQTEAEGIEDLVLGEGFVIPVAHIDVLPVFVEVPASEMAVAGGILVVPGHRVRQPSARLSVAVEHVNEGVSGLHAPLEGVEQGPDGVRLYPGQIHDVSCVHHHADLPEGPRDLGQQGFFRFRQVVAPGHRPVVHGLSHGPAQDHHGGIVPLGGSADLFLTQGHFRVTGGPLAPVHYRGHIGLAPEPIPVRQGLVIGNVPPGLQGVHGAHQVIRVHIASGAVAHVEVVPLDPTEKGCGAGFAQGQHPVVFEQYRPFRPGSPAGIRHFLSGFRLPQSLLVQLLGQGIPFLFRHRHRSFF